MMNEPVCLLWAHVLLIFTLANYGSRDVLIDESDTEQQVRLWRVWVVVRSFVAMSIVAYASGSLLLGGFILFASLALPFLRALLPARFCAEFEVAGVTTIAVTSLYLSNSSRRQLEITVFQVPASNARIAAALFVTALFLFTIHGGTYIVRGILKKSGAIPKLPSAEPEEKRALDVKEFNRGRLIGALERVLLFAVVVAGSYEALGFIIAAKGLVRSRELETNRDMTEYFLIGSLTSVLIALGTGSIARYLIQTYW